MMRHPVLGRIRHASIPGFNHFDLLARSLHPMDYPRHLVNNGFSLRGLGATGMGIVPCE